MDIVVIVQIIKYLAAIVVAVLLGNGAVYMFNHMPGKWFLDHDEDTSGGHKNDSSAETGGEEPEQKTDVFGAGGPESLIDGRGRDSGKDTYRPQRVRSTPWKYYFSMLFIVAGLYLVKNDWVYASAVMVICWILLELSVADIKYRVIPDQLVILLAVSAIGLIQYHNWRDMLWGAALGFGIMSIAALLGKAMYRRDAVGGGDIKLFAAIGLLLGIRGVIAVFMISALLSGAHMVALLAMHKIKRNDTIPMVPYIAAAASIYLIFIWQGPAAGYFDQLIL